MASQGAPEVPKSPRMSKRRHRDPQMAIPRSQSGLAAEGVALKIISVQSFWNLPFFEMSFKVDRQSPSNPEPDYF